MCFYAYSSADEYSTRYMGMRTANGDSLKVLVYEVLKVLVYEALRKRIGESLRHSPPRKDCALSY